MRRGWLTVACYRGTDISRPEPATLLIPAWNIRTIQRVDRRKIYRFLFFFFFSFLFLSFSFIAKRSLNRIVSILSYVDYFEETNRVIFSSNLLIFLRGKRRSTMSSNRIQRFFLCFRKQRKERSRFLALWLLVAGTQPTISTQIVYRHSDIVRNSQQIRGQNR